eukprot:317622-Pelagomonas_calceolata.AAC.1
MHGKSHWRTAERSPDRKGSLSRAFQYQRPTAGEAEELRAEAPQGAAAEKQLDVLKCVWDVEIVCKPSACAKQQIVHAGRQVEDQTHIRPQRFSATCRALCEHKLYGVKQRMT